MTELTPFVFPETGHQVRVIERDGEPLLHHADICRLLEHTNPTVALRMVDEDERALVDMRGIDAGQTALNFATPPTGNAEAWFVTEAGFYGLALRSKAPGAKSMRRWVTHEVLPSIRRTGSYQVETPRLTPLEYAERLLDAERRAEAERVAKEQTRAELDVAAPKAESWDTLASADGDYGVGDAAKILARDPAIEVGQNRLFDRMHGLGWVFRGGDRRWRAYQWAVDRDLLAERPMQREHPEIGRVAAPPQIRVTVRGIHQLHRELGGRQAPLLPIGGAA